MSGKRKWPDCAGHVCGLYRRRPDGAFAGEGFSKLAEVGYTDAGAVVVQAKDKRKSAKQQVNEQVDGQGN
jgi:hypothetical protein